MKPRNQTIRLPPRKSALTVSRLNIIKLELFNIILITDMNKQLFGYLGLRMFYADVSNSNSNNPFFLSNFL